MTRITPLALGVMLGVPAVAHADESVAEANKLLLEVSRAYSRLPALTDEMTVSIAMPGMPAQKSTTTVLLSGDDARVEDAAMTFDLYVVRGTMYTVMEGNDKGAVATELGDDPVGAASTALGMAWPYVPPHLPLRWMKNADGITGLFTFGMIEEPVVAGHEVIDTDDDAKLHEVLIKGKNDNSVRVAIDPKTKLIHSTTLTATDPAAGLSVTVTTSFRPKIIERVEKPIAFDTDGLELYSDLMGLMASAGPDFQPGIKAGDEAPGFELVDQDGRKHTLESYKGQVVVLDWWGIW